MRKGVGLSGTVWKNGFRNQVQASESIQMQVGGVDIQTD